MIGRSLAVYLRLLAPLFGLIAAVWALRLVLDAAGAPAGLIRVCSVTLGGAVSVLLAAALIHFKRFGSYSEVVKATILLVVWQQLLISGAIAFSALSGIPNVFAAPEFTPHRLSFARHIAAHLTFGVGFGALFGSGMSSLLFWVLRRLMPLESVRRA